MSISHIAYAAALGIEMCRAWRIHQILYLSASEVWHSKYRTLAIITRGFYYFSIFSCGGFSLMFGGIPMKLGGYKTREVTIRAWLMMASVG